MQHLLGEGGKKRVYLAWDTRLDRQVALAVVHTTAVSAEEGERIRAEARALGRLAEHPNVVTIYDTGERDGQPFIVSEYMAGGDLRTLLACTPRRRLPIRHALEIAEQIARGLEHAHERGIVHRDLKPANVWLTADGVAKLGDFGLALATGHAEAGPSAVGGTAAYTSPEQAQGAPADARSDLYSLGVVLYEMVTGRLPFVAGTALSILAQHVNSPPEPPSAVDEAVPPPVSRLILRLLAKTPAERPPSAAAVRRDLQALLAATEADAAGASLTATAEWPRFDPPRGSGGRWTRVGRTPATLLVLALGLAAVLTLQALERRRAQTPMPTPPAPTVVGVMDFAAEGSGADLEWMCKVTRDGLNAILSRVDEVRVYAKEMIDFKREKFGLGEIEVAQDLGITKMVSGTVGLTGLDVSVELRVVDIRTGFLDATISRRRPRAELIDLQNEIAAALLGALGVSLSPERLHGLLGHRQRGALESYERFYEALGDIEGPPEVPPPPEGDSRMRRPWRLALAGVAHAEDNPDEGAIQALLEAYRVALEAEDIERLATLHLRMSDRQRTGLARYFLGVRDLRVRLSHVDVTVAGDEALVSYTREDLFTDERSGRPVHLDTRLSRLLAKRDGVWKIGHRKDPS